MTRPKNPASIVSRKRSRWNSGASADATVTQEKRTMLNGQRKPNHQTFFLQIPTRSGSTRGRTVSSMVHAPSRRIFRRLSFFFFVLFANSGLTVSSLVKSEHNDKELTRPKVSHERPKTR